MRIGIVNNLPREVEILRQALALRPEHPVVWVGKSIAETMRLSTTEPPDLILIGLLAGIDAVEATRQIMASAPCAIVIVADNLQVNAARVFEAMGHGALDVVGLPATGNADVEEGAAPLLAKISTVSRLLGEKTGRYAPAPTEPVAGERHQPPLVAIGASAGGPLAVAAVLRGVPKNFPAAMVVIQHVGAEFATGMADWLSEQSTLPVVVAREGDTPTVARVLLAGTGDHLTLKSGSRLGYTAEPRSYVYRPSVDVFFESVSRLWQGEAVGVLLTGMGNDGAQGLKALRDRGYHTIAQDEATSAVYGMPKAAAALDAAVDILPMDRIAPRVVELITGLRHQIRGRRHA